MSRFCKRAVRDDSGQDLIEYAFLAVFIAVIAWVTVDAIGGNVQTLFGAVSSTTSAAGS